MSTNTKPSTMPEVPDEFICPITLELMQDPVVSRYGKTFERKAILNWLSQHGNTCPITRQQLKLSDLIGNYSLKLRIATWCSENGLSFERSTGSSEFLKPEDVVLTVLVSDVLKSLKTSKRNRRSTRRFLRLFSSTTDRPSASGVA